MNSEIRKRTAVAAVVVAVLGAAAWAAIGTGAVIGGDPEKRLAGYARHLEMKSASPHRGATWQFVGPANISGRCTSLAVVTPKGKHYTLFAGTASGGLWKSVNEGVSWEPVFENGPSTAIGAVALAPSDPQTVWIGTGEANIFRSSQSGCGVYRSSDGGTSWQHMGLAATHTIARIVVHPANPDIVWVAASGREWTENEERGVFKTVDGGRSWRRVLFVSAQAGAIDLRIDPRDPDTLYAATWQRTRRKWNDPRCEPGHTGSGIFKTRDGGSTWVPINAGLPAPGQRGRIGIDLCRERPDTLYALLDDYGTDSRPAGDETDAYGRPSSGTIRGATVYRSDDAGASWRQASGLTPEMKTYMADHSGTYGWVFGQVRADPRDPETVYILGVPLSVSHDGGRTFTELEGMHVDHHDLWIDPDNTAYLLNANDGGISVSYDGGRRWRSFLDNLPATQFFNVALDMATPFRVYGSIQDIGSRRGVVDLARGRDKIRPVDFEYAPGGEGCRHAIDPRDPDVVYSAGFYGTLTRSDMAKPRAGRTRALLPRTYPDEPKLRGQWLAPFLLSPHNPDIILHGMQFVFRSADRGATWERISPDLSAFDPAEQGDIPYHTLFALVESPLRAGLIYAGCDDGSAHVSRDNGRSWKPMTAGLAARRWVSSIVASAYDLGTVFLTQNGKRDDDFTPYVWKSIDFGRTWTSIAAGVPLGPVNVIREDPFRRGMLYLGTDLAVYVSADSGLTWQVLGGNLPAAYVHDIAIHPRDNILVIATHGRGIWALDLDPVNKGRERRPSRWEEEPAGEG